MSVGQLQQAIATYRDALARHEAMAERALEQAYRHTLSRIQPKLDRLSHEMLAAMGEDGTLPLHWLYEAHRLESLKAYLSGQIDHFALLARQTVGQVQRTAVQLGEQAGMAQMQATVPEGVRYSFGAPSPDAIANLVGATQDGSPLADLFGGFGQEAAQKAGDALIAGVANGENPRVVAGSVQDALDISRSRALTISRTEMLRGYRSANLATYQANSDVVQQWRWTASPSARTCAMCLAMDGQTFDLSDDFASHPNCRCAPVPVTASWADILGPLGIDTSDLQETSIDLPTASDWFDQQNAAVQRQILGPAKLAAYQDGALSLQNLVKQGHDPQWGGYRQEKSLKDALGAKAAAKYSAKAS